MFLESKGGGLSDAAPSGGAVVLSEGARRPRAHPIPAGTRTFAFAFLLVVGIHFGYGVSPLMASRCACSHGPEVPCDCPHHLETKGQAPPPCHIHAKSRNAADRTSKEPSVRARCGKIAPDLILVALLSTFERPDLPSDAGPDQRPALSPARPPRTFIPPPKHPPKKHA